MGPGIRVESTRTRRSEIMQGAGSAASEDGADADEDRADEETPSEEAPATAG